MKRSSVNNVAGEVDVQELLTLVEHHLGNCILRQPNPFLAPKRQGYLRGVEYYTGSNLIRAMLNAFLSYRNAHGEAPNLTEPKTFSEKMVWSKFFAAMKVPEAGNKLLTSYFIPEEAKDLVSCPEIVWHSRRPELPGNDELEPGSYYLKTNFGCNMYRRIDFPLTPAQRAEIQREFAGHLKEVFGVLTGEWWYSVFPPELMIERDVSGGEDSVAFCYYVFGGEIAFVSAYRKSNQDSTLLTADFDLFEYQIPSRSRTDFSPPSVRTREMMRQAAEMIGRPLPFARIDFLMSADEQFYLGEVTFTPGNARTRLPAHIARRLGDMWVLDC